MMVNIEKETWKNQIMESLRGMQRAEPNPYLFTRIESRLQYTKLVTPTQLRWAGIALAIILVLNITAIVQTKSTSEASTVEYSLSNFSTY